MAYKRLGDLLIAAGLINEDDLNRALQLQKGTTKRLGDVLTESGIITQDQLIRALELQLGVDYIDLSKTPLPPELAEVLPKTIAKRHNVVPVRLERGELYLAMSDPLNFMALEEVKLATRRKVIPMIATREQVDRAIITLYGNENAARAIEEMRREAVREHTEELLPSSVHVTKVDDENAAPSIRLVNSIIERAVTERASDIHLEPRENEMVVRLRVDGQLHNALTVPRALQGSVISRLKVMGDMNISERKLPQDGRANILVRGSDPLDLRMSTLPTIYGEKMVVRILDKSSQTISLEQLGLTEANRSRFELLLRNTSGVLLISGPTGSGKSSTMSVIIRRLNRETVNIVTLEDPVEYDIDGVNQCQISEKTGMTFAEGLRSVLRQDPDIIAVGEIRDGETAEIAMRSAITGHLVLSTIHTSDCAATLDRLHDMEVAPYLTASALRGVIAQRLVRKLCPYCAVSYEPTADELALLGLKPVPGLKLRRSTGCPHCFHTGYRGRTGVFEILPIDADLRKLVHRHAPREELLAAARKKGFRSLAENCRELVLSGVTSVEEAARVIYSAEE